MNTAHPGSGRAEAILHNELWLHAAHDDLPGKPLNYANPLPVAAAALAEYADMARFNEAG